MGNIVVIAIIVLLILLLIFWERITNSRIYKQVAKLVHNDFMQLPPAEPLFQIAWDAFLFMAAVIVTLYASNASGLVNMTTLWIMLAGFFLIALMVSLRIKLQPKDRRLDNLVEEVKKLSQRIDNLIDTLPNKETINNLNSSILELITTLKENRKQ